MTPVANAFRESRTERDTRVLLTDILTIVVGEEHVCGQTALGRIGICEMDQSGEREGRVGIMLPFFLLPPVSALALDLRVAFSLGIVMFSAMRCS